MMTFSTLHVLIRQQSQHVRTQSRAQLRRIQIFIKARPRVAQKSLVHFFDQRQLIATDTPGNGKDRQDAALMTRGAVIIALAEFPASLDGYGSVPAIGAKVIFKVSVRRSVRTRHRGYNRNVADTRAGTRIGNAEL